ncbi:hypothetical protein M501DRAFT_1013083 [Patellaria atrata CBS 101060]|uniref:Uncharacterized protein n=1 Tax=Patellaria atrata CBS 101060 TaxID=1346257 RepID=A0A9P4VW57_9PEZI|nr:hypothetical protein M501DRAFT_1013083 [Patellaria atrata CBS 101060]
MPNTAHRSKRPVNQHLITSFLTTSPNVTTTSTSHFSGPGPAPTLPAHVQSSLLNVGMRVRKSVPEGYKTHKTMPTVTVEIDAPIEVRCDSDVEIDGEEVGAGRRELMPFCGLHKTGGLGVQANSRTQYSGVPSFDGDMRPQNAYDIFNSSLPSSQESLASTISTVSVPTLTIPTIATTPARPSAKRRFTDEDEERTPDNLHTLLFPTHVSSHSDDAPVSPKSAHPTGMANFLSIGQTTRPIARPRPRRKPSEGKENAMVGLDGNLGLVAARRNALQGNGLGIGLGIDLDFGEAEFLRGEWEDEGEAMEM